MKKISKIRNSQKGFTLIELLVAAFIFVIAITLSVGIFTTSSGVQSKTEVLRSTSQTGRYILEAITREVRLAESFEIMTDLSGNYSVNSTNNRVGNFLKTVSRDPISGTLTTKVFTLVTENDLGKVKVQTNGGQFQDISPSVINVTNLNFEGYVPTMGSQKQPFVTIDLKVKHTASIKGRAAEKAEETLRTTINQRNYLIKQY